jgi:threonine dehydrogenase-like Zn-dependent dehydrogenase
MRALTVRPSRPDSAEVTDLPDPEPAAGDLLVDAIAMGVCGTDREIIAGEHGAPPPDRDRLVLGHESLGRVRRAPAGSDFAAGDLVAGVVRRPDPEPCGACAHGEFDMCRNGRYSERGIKGLDGYGSEVWTVEADYAVRLDPALGLAGVLMEPTSIVAKAWEQIERVGARAWFEPRTVLVTGAGPIGLLAALLGVQRDLDVHVLNRSPDSRKRAAVADLGATFHPATLDDLADRLRPDILIEATGSPTVAFEAMAATAAYGIVCLTGVSPAGRPMRIDAGAVNRDLVLENDVVFGTVNANLRHYAAALDALVRAPRAWLDGLITRRVPLERYREALERRDGDIKVVLTLD